MTDFLAGEVTLGTTAAVVVPAAEFDRQIAIKGGGVGGVQIAFANGVTGYPVGSGTESFRLPAGVDLYAWRPSGVLNIQLLVTNTA